MKWTKLDGFNQPNGATLMRWDDYFDGKESGYQYAVGNYENECFYFLSTFNHECVDDFDSAFFKFHLHENGMHLHISKLMDDDAYFLNLIDNEDSE